MTRQELWYLFLIILIFIAACIETDIYLPAFPDMMVYFNTSEETIQSLLTWNFAGICISGPFYGPVSDAIGRKKLIMIALGLFLIGSIVTLFADDFDFLLVGRILQGLGSGGCFTLGTAVIFDTFQEERAIKAINLLNVIVPLIMATAPLVGGFLNYSYGFRSNFWAIAIFVFLSFVCCLLFLPETLPEEKRTPFSAATVYRSFKMAFTSVPFWQVTILFSLLFAGYLAFVSGISVLYVKELGVTVTEFPWFQGSVLGAYVTASLTCSRMIAKFGPFKVKMSGLSMIILGAISLFVASFWYATNPYILTLTMLFYAFGCSWVMGPYFGEAMEIMPEIKGVTASLLSSARLLVTALLVGLASSMYDKTIFPIVWVVLGATVVSTVLAIAYESSAQKNRA